MVAFDHLVDRVMNQPPYCQARRVFWIVDNGSSHRGVASVQRLQQRYPRLQLVHGPVHGSWLNQIEVSDFLISRKLTGVGFAPASGMVQKQERAVNHPVIGFGSGQRV